MSSGRIPGIVFRATVVLVGAVLLWAGWSGFRVWRAWTNVERVDFQTADARIALQNHTPTFESTDDDDGASDAPLTEGDVATEVGPGVSAGNTFSGEGLRSYLVIGSDQRAEIGASRRADVILLVMIPAQADPIFVSIPRDLYLPNPCTSGFDRINATLNGCGDFANGPELLALTVEDFTGVSVDHFAVFDFDGFKAIVDRVGGVEICVDTPIRDLKVEPNLNLDTGCTTADGETALSWVRSRKTQEFVDGSWRTVSGVNDLTRNDRQQDLLVQALRRLKGFGEVGDFAGIVEDVSDAFAIDEGLSLSRAIDIAWGLRSIDPSGIVRIQIPVSNYITPGGAYVLIPEASFEEVLTEVYPDADSWLAGA
jgi:LCP family protein required for cell wall assembly